MTPTPSLPQRLYLLSVDVDRQRLRKTSVTGQLMRAAALTQLWLDGALVEGDDGKPRAVRGAADRVRDPFLRAVLDDVEASKPRSWKRWVSRSARDARAAVRDQLARDAIRVEPRRILGVVPAERIVVLDRRAAQEMRRSTARDITGSRPVAQLDRQDAAAAALAAVAALDTVCRGRERRAARRRIAELVDRSGPAVPALKSVIRDSEAAASSAAVG